MAATVETVGKPLDPIPVSISYRIIELFSAGLYSSPNKAVEELVANSYDAMARNVNVVVPESFDTTEDIIWVVDDGAGMDVSGLTELWQIASSHKRDPGRESASRPPIGRFGIGKLASYVLAHQLTHITKFDGVFRAITMDFHEVEKDKTTHEKTLKLPIRELTEKDAKELLSPLLSKMGDAAKAIPLFGK